MIAVARAHFFGVFFFRKKKAFSEEFQKLSFSWCSSYLFLLVALQQCRSITKRNVDCCWSEARTGESDGGGVGYCFGNIGIKK